MEVDNKMKKKFTLGYMIDSLMVNYMNYPRAKSTIDSMESEVWKEVYCSGKIHYI